MGDFLVDLMGEQEPDWSASFSEEDRRLIEESVARAQDTMFSVEEWEDVWSH